ncbi:MAG: TatD family hydrolase [Polaromonas sp.]|nr:TatD family hydrolase [Polaromonas sp.]
MPTWIDTHCHLDAEEFAPDRPSVALRAAAAGIRHCVLPATDVGNFAAVRDLASAFSYSYALGIHPLRVASAEAGDLEKLDAELALRREDPRLVAVGEIGLDFFVPELQTPVLRARQEHFYRAQLRLARQHDLPVILHVRRSSDRLLKALRELLPAEGRWRGIAHAFNGSAQQAGQFIALGFKLGFGGAVTYEAARQLRRLAASLPLDALVLETDSPDIPPQWIYRTAAERAAGQPQGRNEPAQLPQIAAQVAELRGMSVEALAAATGANARDALPKLAGLLAC